MATIERLGYVAPEDAARVEALTDAHSLLLASVTDTAMLEVDSNSDPDKMGDALDWMIGSAQGVLGILKRQGWDTPSHARMHAEAPMMLAALRETLAVLQNPDASDFDAARLESAIAGLLRRIDGEAP